MLDESPRPPAAAVARLHLGEIHTGILQSSAAITAETAREILASIPHQPVRTWERPVRHAASPEVLTGVDCAVPSGSGGRARGIGTVAAQTRITAGRIVQACTRTEMVPSGSGRRMQWSYYLARPARVEVVGRFAPDDVAAGFLGTRDRTTDRTTDRPVDRPVDQAFDLGAVCAECLGEVQRSHALDHRAPLPVRRSRLRWAATVIDADEPGTAALRVDDELRTLQVRVPPALLGAVPELCRDLALHDWLLTSAAEAVDRAGVGHRDRADVVRRLGPFIDHLLHAWMPAIHVDDGLLPYWQEIDRRSGLGRQWGALVRQVRDQVALAAIDRPLSIDLTDRRTTGLGTGRDVG